MYSHYFHGKDEEWTYKLNIRFDPDDEDYIAEYIVNGEVLNEGRGSSTARAVDRLGDSMNNEIEHVLNATRYARARQ